jgi:hypothetical protein
VHESALLELHVSVEVPPSATALGDALRIAVGRGLTVTAALSGTLLPPGPVQVSTKFALPLNAPLLWLPLVGKVPLQSPDAAQEVALLEVQVNVEDAPALIVAGDAVSEAVGSGGGGGGGALEPPPHADKVIGPTIKRQCKERTSSRFLFFSI